MRCRKNAIFVADFGTPKTGLKSDEIVQISRLIFELNLSTLLVRLGTGQFCRPLATSQFCVFDTRFIDR